MLVKTGIISLPFYGKTYYLDLSNTNHPISECNENKHFELEINNSSEDDPYFVVFVTDDCNMKCDYCFNSRRKASQLSLKPQYSIDDFVTFLNKYFVGQDVGIRFFGGEPLLNKDWIYKFVNRLSDEGINVEYNVFTNATLISDEFLDFAEENKFKFYVSIDGGVDRYKGELFGDKISCGIYKLLERHINTVARMVWIPNDKRSLTSLIIKGFNTGVRVVSFTFEWGKSNLDEIQYTEQIKEFADFYVDKVLHHDFRYIGVAPFIRYITKWITKEGYNAYSCAAGRSMYSISTDGSCYPCQCFDKNTKYSSGSIFNLKKNVFGNISAEQIEPCSSCDVRFFCKARCYADAFYTTGDIKRMNASRCKAEKTIIGASAYILAMLQEHPKEYNGFKMLVEKVSRIYKD